MKKKKLSFQEISGALSRNEMKEIMGGVRECTYECTCNNGETSGCHGTSSHCRDFTIGACQGGGGTCTISYCE